MLWVMVKRDSEEDDNVEVRERRTYMAGCTTH